METDERYIIFREYALALHRGDTSLDPRKLSLAISSAEELYDDEKRRNSPNRLDLGEMMNLGMAMRAENHYLRREKDMAKKLMKRGEAQKRLSDYVKSERVIFQEELLLFFQFLLY